LLGCSRRLIISTPARPTPPLGQVNGLRRLLGRQRAKPDDGNGAEERDPGAIELEKRQTAQHHAEVQEN
jgi:hypothetical protein